MKRFFETKYAGLDLQSPIIVGSSGLTNSVEKNKELEKAGAGAIVLKSLFEEQISLESNWMTKNSDYPEVGDFIQNYLKDNLVSDYLDLLQQSKKKCKIPIIASINCYKPDAWIDFAHQIESAGADAIELNLHALNTSIETDPNELENNFVQIVEKVKSVVQIPVILKIGRNFANIVNVVNRFHKSGASGIVLFNRFYQPDIDIHKMQIVSGQVFSSHSDLAETLRWTAIVSGKLPEVSLASSTGILDWEDVVKCILAGASAVEVCSTVYQHGIEIIPQMKRSIEEWMTSMQFRTINDFKGKFNTASAVDPSMYERIQFMKYFSYRD